MKKSLLSSNIIIIRKHQPHTESSESSELNECGDANLICASYYFIPFVMIIIVQRNPWIFIIGGGRKSKNLDEDIKIKFNFRHKNFATPNFSRSFRGSIKFADQNQSSVWLVSVKVYFALSCELWVAKYVLDRFLAVLATRRPPHRGGGFKLYGFGSSTQRLYFLRVSLFIFIKREKTQIFHHPQWMHKNRIVCPFQFRSLSSLSSFVDPFNFPLVKHV